MVDGLSTQSKEKVNRNLCEVVTAGVTADGKEAT